MVTTKTTQMVMGSIISVHTLKVKVPNPWHTIQPKVLGSQGLEFFFFFWVAKTEIVLQHIPLISLHLVIFWHRQMQVPVTFYHTHKNKKNLSHYTKSCHLSRGSRAVIIGSQLPGISLCLPHTYFPFSLLHLLNNDIWPREGTQQPRKLKPLKDSS